MTFKTYSTHILLGEKPQKSVLYYCNLLPGIDFLGNKKKLLMEVFYFQIFIYFCNRLCDGNCRSYNQCDRWHKRGICTQKMTIFFEHIELHARLLTKKTNIPICLRANKKEQSNISAVEKVKLLSIQLFFAKQTKLFKIAGIILLPKIQIPATMWVYNQDESLM